MADLTEGVIGLVPPNTMGVAMPGALLNVPILPVKEPEKKWLPKKGTPKVFVFSGVRIDTEKFSEKDIARLIEDVPGLSKYFEKV